MNSFQLILILSLCVCISLYELYSIKPSYFTENMIYVTENLRRTADSYHLKSGTIYSQWNYLSIEIINKLLIR